jgi:hypothetical protein
MHALLVVAALVGRIHAYVEDHADGTSRTGYALHTPAGELVELAPTTSIAAHVGDWVVIDGDSVQVTAAPVEPAPVAHIAAGEPRTVRVAVVLLDFAGSAAQDFDAADAAARMATVRAYYQEISYGLWNIESEVFGPYVVERPGDCSLDTIGALARQQADLATFDHVAITLPANEDTGLDCACGVAWLGRTPAQPGPEILHTSLYTCTDANAFAHELGHGFGLHHASTADCDGAAFRREIHDACAIAEYGNQFNTMGNGLGHMNAFQKGTMRWLDRCNVLRISRNATLELVAIPIASDGAQALQIATGDSRDGNPLYYYVELRDPSRATFNAGGDPPREQGPGVHIDVAPDVTIADGDRRPLLLDLSPGTPGAFVDPRLTAGRSFTDPDGRVTITVLDLGPDGARVQVTFPDGGTGENTCLDGSALPEPEPEVSPDAAPTDSPDAGSPALDDDDALAGGCGCGAGGGAAAGAPGMLLLLALAVSRTRRRASCAPRHRRSAPASPR